MKILFLAPVPPPDHGGIINWTRLVKTGFQNRPKFTLFFVDSARRYRDVTDTSIFSRLIFGSAQAIRDSIRIFYQFRRIHPDVFHLCTSGGPAALKDAFLVFMMRIFNIPVIMHYHMGRLPQILASQSIENRLTRYILKGSSAVLVLGNASEEAVLMAAPDQVVINLPNMVDTDEIDGIRFSTVSETAKGQHLNITFVGHVIPTKGIEELVRACAALQNDKLVLHLVGPCSDVFREILTRAAQEKDNGNWLHFYGSVEHDEALRHIFRCDLFVLPSYTEGAPNVILEAMSMGKPILATSVGSIPEMLTMETDMPCGVCIAPKSVFAIQNGISDFFNNSARWQEFGENARRRARQIYSMNVVCDHLGTLWKDVANGQQRVCFGRTGQAVLKRGGGR